MLQFRLVGMLHLSGMLRAKEETEVKTKYEPGFTLIELLVVIAIIAILAAILFPVFVGARDAARKGACLNYLSELGKAQLLYRDAYNDRLPLHFAWLSSQSGTGCYGDYSTYYFLLRRYTNNKTGSFQCPATPPPQYAIINNVKRLIIGRNNYPCWASGIGMIADQYKGGAQQYLKDKFNYPWVDPYQATSYAAFLYPRNAGAPKSQWNCFVVSARYRKPSRVVYLFEAVMDFCIANEQFMYADDDRQGGYLAPRHSGSEYAGLLFFDGHAEMRTRAYIRNNAGQLLAYDDPDK
jgi:prepilin-type N-terminal cleavage/methylation domain-containing protein/prepilin-type processing-associated H-X9-DG protein